MRGLVVLLAGLFPTTGCTTTYTVAESTVPTTNWTVPPRDPAYQSDVSVGQNSVTIQLQAVSCQSEYEAGTVTHGSIYKNKTFFAGPGLVLGGLAAGGLGTALFVSAKDAPTTCAPNDDDCLSQDDQRGFAIIASGLAVAGLIVGTYNSFKRPVLVGPAPDQYTRQQLITADCTPDVGGIVVGFGIDSKVLAYGRTDAGGGATLSVDDTAAATWPNVVDLYVNRHYAGAVDLSILVNPARTRLVERIRAEEAEREAARPPPPPPPARQDPPTANDENVGWVYWARSTLYELMAENPQVCETVLSASADLVITATFGEEELAAELIARLLGKRYSKAIATIILPVLHGTRIVRQIAETYERVKASGAHAACGALQDLIKP
jgi:hypothetical protein